MSEVDRASTGSAAPQRMWAMSKIGPGDWFLLSNDKRTAWRFTQYEDGPTLGLMDWLRDRKVWHVRCQPADQLAEHGDIEHGWRDSAGPLFTRQACIDYAMSHERGEAPST